MATRQQIITAGQQKVQETRQAKASTLLTVKSDAQKRCEQQGGQFIGGKCVFKRKETEPVKAPLPEGTVTVGGRVVQTKEEPKTPEQIRLERDIEERIDPTKRTARISEDIGISPEDVAALTPEQKKTRLEEEVERVEKQAELTRQEVVERADIRREQIGRGVSAFKSAFAVSRGGVLANVGLGAGIAKAATAQLQTIDRNIEQFELQQESSRERLEDARRKGLTSIVKSESERIARIQTELLKEQTKFSEQEEGVRTKALEAIDFLDSLSAASIAGFDETEISQLFQQAGLPSFAASAFISENLKLSTAEAELAKDPENVEKRNRVLALQGKVSQIKTEIGKTTKVEQEIAGFQRLLETNVITQDQFDQAVSGQIAVETAKEIAEKKKIEAQTREIEGLTTVTSPEREINIAETTTGSPLPLNSLGDSLQISRADRHNNPTANKAYDVTIQRLKDAGLEQGVDFNIGETTEGIDDDGVATIVYSSPEMGVRGAIAGLTSGTIGSWYANDTIVEKERKDGTKFMAPLYGGSKRVQAKLSILSGEKVTLSNAQEVFNGLNASQKTEVVKTIYAHEGGTQLFRPIDKVTVILKPKEKIEAEDKLRKESTKLATSIKNFKQFANNIDVGIKEFERQKEKGGDLSAASQAIIFGFNKLLDEGSVVRESEFARTAAGQSLLARLSGGLEQVKQGGAGVTIETLKSVQSIADQLLNSAEKSNRDLLIPVRRSAEKQGLDLEAIFSPFTIQLLEEVGINIDDQQDFTDLSDDDFLNQGEDGGESTQDNKSFFGQFEESEED